MLKKLNRSLIEDIALLLPAGVVFDNDAAVTAFGRVWKELIEQLPGEPGRSLKAAIEAIRKAKIPAHLDGVYEDIHTSPYHSRISDPLRLWGGRPLLSSM